MCRVIGGIKTFDNVRMFFLQLKSGLVVKDLTAQGRTRFDSP